MCDQRVKETKLTAKCAFLANIFTLGSIKDYKMTMKSSFQNLAES